MAELQQALGDLVAGLPEPIERAVDLENALRVDKKLGWQVFRIVRSSSLAEVANVPSRRSASRFLSAAKARGLPSATIENVRAAFRRFDEFAAEHGGDREG